MRACLLVALLVLPTAVARSDMVCEMPAARGCRVPEDVEIPRRLPEVPDAPEGPELPPEPPLDPRDACQLLPVPPGAEEPIELVRARVEGELPEPVRRDVVAAFEELDSLRPRCRVLLG